LFNVSAYLLPPAKVKIKVTLEKATKARRDYRKIAILFL
jgi:hypothetical protein